MGLKFRGIFALGNQSAKGSAGSADIVLLCEDANIQNNPVFAERTIHMQAMRLPPVGVGFDHVFSANGIEATPTAFGRIARDAIGKMAEAGSGPSYTHTITLPLLAESPPYATIFCDRNIDFSAGNSTQKGIDAMYNKFEFECAPRQVGKISVGGGILSCVAGTSLTASIGTITGIVWSHLYASGGHCKTQVGGVTLAQDNTLMGFKFAVERSIGDGLFESSQDQPTDWDPGYEKLTFEISKRFTGIAEYDEFIAQGEIGVDLKFAISSEQSVQVTIPHAKITSPLMDGVGGSEDPITLPIQAEAYNDPNDSDEPLTIVVTDTVAAY